MGTEFSDISLNETLIHLMRLGISYLLAIPTALNRERHSRGAGLRTFPLVAVGACGYMLIGRQVLGADEAYSRVIYGVITGIGFIGGGAILKEGRGVRGTATASSIWIMGALGIAVAWQRYEIAVIMSIVSVFTLWLGAPLKGYLESTHVSEDDPYEKRE